MRLGEDTWSEVLAVRVFDDLVTGYKTTGRVKEHLVTGPAISLNPRPSRLAVYQLTLPSCKSFS